MTADDRPPDRDVDVPADVAREILALDRPTALVLDCDGVLAPLTDHADDSVLLDGTGDRLERLGQLAPRRDVTVAVLSGRSLSGLEQFGFADSIDVLGSYGSERRGRPSIALSPAEDERLRRLDEAAEAARVIAGDGAWVERKPASVVLHVRQADRELGGRALRRLADEQAQVDGSTSHEGSNVLEVLARDADKGSALSALREENGSRSVVYVGDDVPDEDAFATLGPGDLGIKVGPGTTAATRRLRDPEAVRDLLGALADLLDG